MSTQLSVNEKVVAVRMFRNGRSEVVMQVTRQEWKGLKFKRAFADDGSAGDVASAKAVMDAWLANAVQVWKSAKEWNDDAASLEEHRFRGVVDGLDGMAKEFRRNAVNSMRECLVVV